MVRTREKLEPVKDQPQQQTMERSKNLKVSKINRRSILCFVLTLAIAGILLVPVATVSGAYPPATFTQEWPLQLVGASTADVTQAQFEAMAAAHPASYTDNVGNVWDGVAMWRLVALVDDIDPATFNSAADNVCTVKETACDNYTSSWSGSILVSSTSSDNYAMVANRYNGNPLPLANPGNSGKPWYPLRAVGSGIGGVGGGKTVGGVIKIELVNLPVTTVSVSPASQTLANGASFTVDLAIDTNQQSRGWQANVAFDATKMQCTGVTEGNFLSAYATANGGGTLSVGAATIDNTGGLITIPGYAITGAGTGGPTGTGTLCTLAFTATTGVAGIATISPSAVVISDASANAVPGVVVVVGQVAVSYTITASASAGGTISPSGSVLLDNGADQSFTITPDTGYAIGVLTVDGSAVTTASSFTFTNVTANHTISASFVANTLTTVVSSANPSVYSQSVTFTATVSAVPPGAGTPTGTLQFQLDGSDFGSAVALVSGSATSSATATLSAGDYTVTAVYVADANFNTSTGALDLTVSQASTSLSVDSATGKHGGTVDVSATLTSGGLALSGQTVVFTLNGTSVGSATTNSSGVATLTGVSIASMNAGTHAGAIGATFAGDTNYSTSSGSADLTVSKAGTAWGAIVGGIIAAIVVVGIGAWLVVRRSHKKAKG